MAGAATRAAARSRADGWQKEEKLSALNAELSTARAECPELLQLTSILGVVGDETAGLITAERNCPNAGSCSCNCLRCRFPARLYHCNDHGGGCHLGCYSN
jgi:hypothetical protein